MNPIKWVTEDGQTVMEITQEQYLGFLENVFEVDAPAMSDHGLIFAHSLFLYHVNRMADVMFERGLTVINPEGLEIPIIQWPDGLPLPDGFARFGVTEADTKARLDS